MSLLNSLETFFDEYLFKPLFDEGISDLYQDSMFETIYEEGIEPVLDYELYRAGSGELSAGRPVTIGSIAKGFAGGFLNIGTGQGGSGLYQAGKPYQAPPIRKVSASPSKVQKGLGVFTPTAVNLASNFGVTDSVKAGLYKATLSDVPTVKNFVAQLTRSANRRAGVRNKLGSQSIGKTKKRTSMPYSPKPKYFG